jgi:hypothetical protein
MTVWKEPATGNALNRMNPACTPHPSSCEPPFRVPSSHTPSTLISYPEYPEYPEYSHTPSTLISYPEYCHLITRVISSHTPSTLISYPEYPHLVPRVISSHTPSTLISYPEHPHLIPRSTLFSYSLFFSPVFTQVICAIVLSLLLHDQNFTPVGLTVKLIFRRKYKSWRFSLCSYAHNSLVFSPLGSNISFTNKLLLGPMEEVQEWGPILTDPRPENSISKGGERILSKCQCSFRSSYLFLKITIRTST